MEDYYGFNVPTQQLKLEHHSRIKPKLSKNIRPTNTGQIVRSLKRTQLSNERLSSKESKKQRKIILPKPVQLNQYKELESALKVVPSENKSLSNRQEIQIMLKKYSSYNNVDSYEFRGNETSRDNKSNCLPEQQWRTRFKRETNILGRETDSYNKQSDRARTPEGKIRNYYSLSRDKRQDYLSLFRRDSLNQRNMIDRFAERVMIPGVLRRSKTASVKPKVLYRMHTYYNAQKREYYNYNESGYRTQKQWQLMNRIERKSLDAFNRVFPAYKMKMKEQSEKGFEIEQNEDMQHRNSGILSNFREDIEQIQRAKAYIVASKVVGNIQRQQTEHKYDESANILIDSRKSSKLLDDYQMGTSFKKLVERPSIGQLLDSKDIFLNFARASEDSLLQFKPQKVKEQNKLIDKQLKESCSIMERVGSEMKEIQINSNCKPQEKVVIHTVPDVVKSKELKLKKQMSSQNDKNSNMQQSNSRSSSEQSSYSHYSDFFSKTISLQSKKYSNEATSPKDKLNFSKKNIKKQSQSLSEGLSDSGHPDLKNTAQFNPIPKHVESQSKGIDLLVESYKFRSSQQIESVISNKIEVEAVKFRIKNISQRSQKGSNRSELEIGGLGMQSFPNWGSREVLDILLKPINEKGSKFQNEVESYNESSGNESAFKAKRQGSSLNKEKTAFSGLQQGEQAISCQQAKKIQCLTQQYDLFSQLQILIQYQQKERNNKKYKEQTMVLLPEKLKELIEKIEAHLHAIDWMRQIVYLIPDVYQLESIYNLENEWILLSLFLTLKKCLYEKERVVTALTGGKNCFNSLCIIEELELRKYMDRFEVLVIVNHVRECNVRLQHLIRCLYQFIIQLNSSYVDHPIINMMVFNNDESLFILLSYFDQEIDVLLYQWEQLRNISESEELVVTKINERIFRLMEIGFIMSNLSGRPIKAVQYEDYSLYNVESQFKNYLFQNHQQFKEVLKYFK